MSLVAWRVVRRVRKNIGRQPVQTKRMIARIVIFSAITLMFGVFGYLFHPSVLLWLGGGLALGVPLAFLGLHLTQFEETPEGHFYTPNTYIGIGLSVILVGRILFRMVKVSSLSGASASSTQPLANITQSGLTLFFFGLVAGYYIAYFTGVLVRAHGLVKK